MQGRTPSANGLQRLEHIDPGGRDPRPTRTHHRRANDHHGRHPHASESPSPRAHGGPAGPACHLQRSPAQVAELGARVFGGASADDNSGGRLSGIHRLTPALHHLLPPLGGPHTETPPGHQRRHEGN